MKFRYPIIGIVLSIIAHNFLYSLFLHLPQFSPIYQVLEGTLNTIIIVSVGLIIYLTICSTFRTIKSVIRKDHIKSQQNRKLQNIDRALDEIESTLDAMTEAGQEDGKITPIWGAGTKKDR